VIGPLLRRAFLRHLRRHPLQLLTTLLGVALGVAVTVGVGLANDSAERAFRLSVAGVAGRASHEIVGGPSGLDETFYAGLRRSGHSFARRSAPVVEGWGRATDAAGRPRRLHLFGVDPFADLALRSFARGGAGSPAAGTLLLAEPGAVALPEELAAELGKKIGDPLEIELGGRRAKLVLRQLIPEGAGAGAFDLVLADIATAQEVLGKLGRIDRIDLRLENAAEEEALRVLLPAGYTLRAKESRAGTLDQMTSAFRLNLTALGLLALVVGLFLIYNTMSFAVVERRALLGRLRTLGVERRQIFLAVLLEAGVLGALGTLAGLGLGIALAQALLELVTRTINDLYFALEVRQVAIDPLVLLRGVSLGLGGALLAAVPAAREATSAPPRAATLRSDLERGARAALPRLLGAGLLLAIAAAACLLWPGTNLALAFAGLFLAVLAYAAAVPAATRFLALAAAPVLGRVGGLLGRMAARGVAASLSRTGVATAALVVAISTTVGVDVMVRSFRATLQNWLEVTLQADLYLAGSSGNARGLTTRPLAEGLGERIAALPGVSSVSTYRRVEVPSPRGPVQLHALLLAPEAFRIFRFKSGDAGEIWPAFAAGEGVIVSEPFAYRLGLERGDQLELSTDSGPLALPILGIHYDYASDRGVVLLARAAYEKHFRDRAVMSLGVFLKNGAEAAAVRGAIENLVAGYDGTVLLSNRDLRQTSIAIFDRTFAITRVLRLLAVAVAFLGIVSALLALQLERAKELATLRALGLTPRQLFGEVMLETGVLGAIAGLLALPLGALLASLLVHVINRRSFGWTLELSLPPASLLEALALALSAALLSGLYPGWKMAGTLPAKALREE
jgi:putative ABC transport system permease protein